MKNANNTVVRLAVGLVVAATAGCPQAECVKVQGKIKSDLVETFSNGEDCPSPLDLCTEGEFTGGLDGTFMFVANTLDPFATQDESAPSDVVSTTGVNQIDTQFCDGTLVLKDTTVFSVSSDGLLGSLQTVDGQASTGGCMGATGRLRLWGVFDEGCVDCDYEGEICLGEQ